MTRGEYKSQNEGRVKKKKVSDGDRGIGLTLHVWGFIATHTQERESLITGNWSGTYTMLDRLVMYEYNNSPAAGIS